MDAGKLRHRVDFEKRIESQDPVSGAVTPVWVKVATSVPAAIEPISVREFLSAKAMQSEITARIVVRQRPGLNAAMRIRHGSRIYNPEGFLADKDSGTEYLTIPCSEGVNDG
jgi:SPP1 family predicted phage head-tail adaptor